MTADSRSQKPTSDSPASSLWIPGITLDHLRERLRNTLAEHVGIELIGIGADHMTATMPVDGRTRQPMRMLHGGASVVLAETIGSLAAHAANHDRTRHFVGQVIDGG